MNCQGSEGDCSTSPVRLISASFGESRISRDHLVNTGRRLREVPERFSSLSALLRTLRSVRFSIWPVRVGFGLTGALCAVASTLLLGGLFVPIMEQIGWFSGPSETGILTDVALGMAASIWAVPIAGPLGFAFGRRLRGARPSWRTLVAAEVAAAFGSAIPWATFFLVSVVESAGTADDLDVPFFVLGVAVTCALAMAAAAIALAAFVLIPRPIGSRATSSLVSSVVRLPVCGARRNPTE